MSNLGWRDWQNLLSLFSGRAYAADQMLEVVASGPAGTTIRTTHLRMRPNQFVGAALQWVVGLNYNEFFIVTSNTEDEITFEPEVIDYTAQAPNPGDWFVLVDATTLARLIPATNNVNVEQWGGVLQTGEDLTPFFQNLDLSLIDLLEQLLGLDARTLTDIFDTLTEGAGETITIATAADISGGVDSATGNFSRWTLFLTVADVIDIDIELSPDGGVTYYDVPESPIVFAAAGDDIIEFGYDATHIRLTGSNANLVTAQIRGII
jgi:hypothetical protein